MGLFGKSITREVGKNTGKWISNKIFGDGHSTPHRVKVTRGGSSRSRSSTSKRSYASVEKEKVKANLRRDEMEHQKELERVKAEAKKSDRVRLKELEHKNSSVILYVGIIAVLGITFMLYKVYDYFTAPCATIEICMAEHNYHQAASYVGSVDRGEQMERIISANVIYLAGEEKNYKAAYDIALSIKTLDVPSYQSYNKNAAFDNLMTTLIEQAILNDDLEEAKKYLEFHPNEAMKKDLNEKMKQ